MLPNRVPSCSSILFSQQSKEFRRLGKRCHWMQGIAFSFKVRQGGLNIGYRCDDLYSDLWRACAGPRVDVPKISERVYYFPQGRMEQVRLVIPKLICIDLGFID